MNIILFSSYKVALLYLKESFHKKQLNKITLITDKITKDLKEFLIKNKINYLITKTLSLKIIESIENTNCLVLSAGSPWIFREHLIKKLGNNFYNTHQSPLPSMKGSVASYIILYQVRSFQVCLHKVTSRIDCGDVVYRKNIFIPSNLKNPFEVNNFLQRMNREMLKEFLVKFENNEILEQERQNNFFSSYNTRLLSDINGWIDWSYKVEDLDRFIRSFGNPYKGAKTFIHNKQVSIKDIEISKQDAARHPDEIGRVIRRFNEYIIISVDGGSLYLKELIWKNKNILDKIKSGDKFYTKLRYLDLKNRRVSFVKNDNIIDSNKTNLIKVED